MNSKIYISRQNREETTEEKRVLEIIRQFFLSEGLSKKENPSERLYPGWELKEYYESK